MTTTQRAATDLLSAAREIADCFGDVVARITAEKVQRLRDAIAAAENADTLGGMIDNALTAKEKLARLWETDSVPEDARKSYEARLEAIYAQMREMDLWRVETHSCYAQIKGESVEIGRII